MFSKDIPSIAVVSTDVMTDFQWCWLIFNGVGSDIPRRYNDHLRVFHRVTRTVNGVGSDIPRGNHDPVRGIS